MNLANILTVFRMALIPLFIISVVYGQPRLALLVFLLAGITDILDGFIARYFNQKTPLGAILDPMADKLMITSAFVVLTLKGPGLVYTIPLWVPVLTITRDVVISLLSLILSLYYEVRNFPPSLLGKCTTFCQISYVVAVLLRNAYGFPLEVVLVFMWAVALFTVASGLHYLWRTKAMSKEFA